MRSQGRPVVSAGAVPVRIGKELVGSRTLANRILKEPGADEGGTVVVEAVATHVDELIGCPVRVGDHVLERVGVDDVILVHRVGRLGVMPHAQIVEVLGGANGEIAGVGLSGLVTYDRTASGGVRGTDVRVARVDRRAVAILPVIQTARRSVVMDVAIPYLEAIGHGDVGASGGPASDRQKEHHENKTPDNCIGFHFYNPPPVITGLLYGSPNAAQSPASENRWTSGDVVSVERTNGFRVAKG